MWPELLDMTREESKRILRRVELEAYSNIVSAFRAQGDLNKDKKRLLHDLQQMLSISTERHRAEVRRAVNDEKLATIADNMTPSNSTQEWLIEGRRLVPLMPRLVPQTAFTVTANHAANLQAEKNAALPCPSQTGNRDTPITTPVVASPPATPRTSRPSSPTSNVVVLPSGMSIHIKGGLNTEDDDDIQIRKRRRSTSTESLVSPTGPPIPNVTYTTTMANMPTASPKKITISKTPQAQPRVVTSGSQTQKVILVSNQGQSPHGGGQKSVSMPVVRSTISTGTSTSAPNHNHNNNKSIIYPSGGGSPGASLANIVTMATPASTTSTTSTVVSPLSSTTVGTSTTAFLTPTISVSRPRFKTVPRQKILQLPSPRPGVVIPMGPQPVQPSPQSLQGLKPGPKNTPTIQIRQEGGMKIITQSVPGGTSKILPKPSQLSGGAGTGGGAGGTPVVVVSAGSGGQTPPSSSTVVTMATRTAASIAGAPAGTKVLNIQTQGGKIISAPRGSSVVTVNPKTLHLTTVKNASGISGTKPNVIVVQKTQPRRAVPSGTPGATGKGSTTAVISSPFEKELVSFLQKQDPTKQYVVTTTTANLAKAVDSQRKVIVTTSTHSDFAKQLSQTLQKSKTSSEAGQVSSNVLHDLIQAAGIMPGPGDAAGGQDGGQGAATGAGPGEVTINLDESQLAALTSVSQAGSQTKVSQSLPSNEWFEYDVTDEQGTSYTRTAESADTAAAIQSLLDMQANTGGHKPKVTVQRSASVDIGQLSDQLNQQQFYTIGKQVYNYEQAMTILNQSEKDQATAYLQTEAQSQTAVEAPDDDDGEILTAVPLSATSLASAVAAATTDLPLTTPTPSITNLVPDATPALAPSGDLDPQTGMFYVDKTTGESTAVVHTDGGVGVGKQQVVVIKGGEVLSHQAVSTATKNYDLLSSSLAQAQIDLDPYQFIDESQQAGYKQTTQQTTQQTTTVAGVGEQQGETNIVLQRVERSDSSSSGSLKEVAATSEPVLVQRVVVSAPVTTSTPSIRIQPSSFIPLTEAAVAKSGAGKTSTINITAAKQPGTVTMIPRTAATSAAATSIHVTVEPSGLDTSHMKMEDFTSQQVTEKSEYIGVDHMEEIGTADSPSTAGSSGLSDSQGEGSVYLDASQTLNVGKRKRKTFSGDDVQSSPPPGSAGAASGGWVRGALGVLNKVAKYRGLNRDKTDLNAATWFTQPVDPQDAPDYYTIVQNPMDFGTIKRKLETGKYGEFEEFHTDMMLVRDNCHLYNPEQSVVRRDCEEVFSYYQQEHDKLIDKWHKTHIASPVSKKPRADRSPIRP